MNHNLNTLAPASTLAAEERSNFIWKCYAHVIAAILAFAAIEVYLFQSGIAAAIAAPMFDNWLLVLGGIMVVSWGASHVALRLQSTQAQYAAFAVLIVAQALLFAPLLYLADSVAPGVIDSAAGATVLGSIGLIATAMITGKDFSFLRGLLVWGGFLALAGIVTSILFGFALGTWFSVAMIAFAGAAILYDTSNIMRHYPADRHVAAAMALFSSIALMFWYILRLFMGRD